MNSISTDLTTLLDRLMILTANYRQRVSDNATLEERKKLRTEIRAIHSQIISVKESLADDYAEILHLTETMLLIAR